MAEKLYFRLDSLKNIFLAYSKRKSIRYGLPFILFVVGGSFGLREWTQIRLCRYYWFIACIHIRTEYISINLVIFIFLFTNLNHRDTTQVVSIASITSVSTVFTVANTSEILFRVGFKSKSPEFEDSVTVMHPHAIVAAGAASKYQFSQVKGVSKEEAEKMGLHKTKEVTLEKAFDDIQKLDIDNWENKRGPRPWEMQNEQRK